MERTLSCSMNISNCSHVDGEKFTVFRISDLFSRRMARNRNPGRQGKTAGGEATRQTLGGGSEQRVVRGSSRRDAYQACSPSACPWSSSGCGTAARRGYRFSSTYSRSGDEDLAH